MGNGTIGLDIGTHAVRAVELKSRRGRPVVRRMGQVALPPGAVVAGEVVEPALVSAALQRLWSEARFSTKSVVVGVANSKIVARLADLPALPEEELRASLRFHVQDLIPMPIEEAELDFQPMGRVDGDNGETCERVLLVAGQSAMLESVLQAVQGAGLTPERIDLIPLALLRAVYDKWDWSPEAVSGSEAVVGVGAGVTNIIVHEQGAPRFVRSLPSGGAAMTEALSRGLGLDSAEAETRKRTLGVSFTSAERSATEATIALPLAQLADDIAGSLEFHLAQSNVALRRVIVTGGGARLELLREALADQIGVPVVTPQAYAGLETSKVPLSADVLGTTADCFTVAIGLALPLATEVSSRTIDLMPARVAHARAAHRQRLLMGAAGAAVIALLTAVTYARGAQVDSARIDAERAEEHKTALEGEVAALSDVEQLQTAIQIGANNVTAALAGDIAWTGLIEGVTAHLPDDVWVTSFTAARGQAAEVGSVQLSALGMDHTSTARWLQRAAELDALASPWVLSSAKAETASGPAVQIAATAELGPGAASERLTYYLRDQR